MQAFKFAAFLTVGVLSASVHAQEFPDLKKQIDAIARPLGTLHCKTTRTGAWEVEGGIVIEIHKPQSNCSFTKLELVIGTERYPSTLPDQSFFVAKTPFGPRYRFHKGDAGKVFFKTPAGVKAEDIKGIWEPNCSDGSCLNEASAAP